jgi:cell division septum initiation protein DivIVA
MQLGLHPVERKTFDIERNGFDRDQVRGYLHDVALTMAQLEGEARAAELAVDDLQLQVRDLSSLSTAGFRQSAANLVTAATPVPAANSPGTETAEKVLAAAHQEAERLTAHAQTIVEEAMLTTERIEANQARLLDAAKASRDLLLRESREEADEIVNNARQAAVETRQNAQRFAEELRELTAAETIQLVSYAKAMAASILEAAGSVAGDVDVTVDLRRQAETTSPVGWSVQPAPSEEGSESSA